MNHEIEKLKALDAIKDQLRSLNWMIFVALLFVIPACVFVIYAGLTAHAGIQEIEKILK